ncbi:hypothetical protein K2173_008650 [Erythroxylum novogranatense]|uniref:BHLH domain-containing protein n=1 Tax=Erythroxylum novogranatense TaxID=1862640 RepID=A0AAV8SLI9_9ROSI|nr:hypothetical protein K2173_008650 [Erythroxylum novogranatense]
MFPLQQGDDLCFKIISFDPHTQNDIPEDLILAHDSVYGTNGNMNNEIVKARRRSKVKFSNPMANITDEAARDSDCKKMMHRDIERLRRQEMATLYSSLRSLLPLEFVKGKRSMSDHMNEAVNYIRHLQKKIKGLCYKREELKKLTNLSAPNSQTGSSDICSPSSVVVRSCLVGIEIGFSTGLRGQSFPLSIVFQVLLEEGIRVVNCLTTTVNERLLHTIQAEVDDPTTLNLSELQQKLINLASSSNN